MNVSANEAAVSSEAADAKKLAHLSLMAIALYVHDQDRSARFYVETLGFELLADVSTPTGARWVVVKPPDGTSNLLLLPAAFGLSVHEQPGVSTGIFLLTDNLAEKHKEWSVRGVHFTQAPIDRGWGGVHAIFADPDGNTINIAESNPATEKIEAERRADQEKRDEKRRLEQEFTIAASVQAKLFPQKSPQLATLSYFGLCQQARRVGGDYYDYLELSKGKVAFIVGDVSGKGIAAALLMANLQAVLRGQCIVAVDDLPSLLSSVNQLFFANSPEASYATLFFGLYEDEHRSLTYVNCGHLPPLVQRGNGKIERLLPTASVLGLFANLPCEKAHIELHPDDRILFYTDGATECTNRDGEEFGEEGLIAHLQQHAALPPLSFVQSLSSTLNLFCESAQSDDITLLLAACQ